ncbi:MAG: Unknown protein [uncultured Sulfurovum sp.]|uniref:Uncharacterized protein n=1 Tax=uncultured Sulfurovum sp. TaxID=269237 RepID=A0A6S6TZV8_9BACT|nr:MAG: Unknown protein [uncultured Sulfurovum sp.]
MYNLFLIRSPLQLINAIEAQQYFKTKKNILCIIHNTSVINSSHMRKVLPLNNWDEIIELNPHNHKNSFLNNVKLIKKLQKKHFKYIFTGDIGNINTAFISSLRKNETYLLDDGTLTLVSHKILNHPYEKEKWNKTLKRNRYKVFGLNCNLKNEAINYFTLFEIQAHSNEKIVKNEFTFFKKTFLTALKKDLNTVYFIGQNLLVENIVSEKTYFWYLKNIIKYYKDKTIIYYPHRFEKITDSYSVIESENFIIKKSSQPIEVELLTKKMYPMYIASFVSSALSSLQKIFQDASIDSFVIKQSELLNHQKDFKLIYENQTKSINQIELNNK